MPRMGHVDWNLMAVEMEAVVRVMPRMGHVDWNVWIWCNGKWQYCHAPHGACGLKYARRNTPIINLQSCPAWGMWIEIAFRSFNPSRGFWSCPAWGMWIEIGSRKRWWCYWNVMPRMGHVDWNFKSVISCVFCSRSCPAWGMWIEIWRFIFNRYVVRVMPRMGHVDWN